MRMFVAGGTGALGSRVVQLLAQSGHEVTATARSTEGAERIRAMGGRPIDIDLFDFKALRSAVRGCDVVFRLTTKIPPLMQMRRAEAWAETGRLRIEGTRLLNEACSDERVGTCIHESITFVYNDGGDNWLDEDSPVSDGGAAPLRDALEAEAEAQKFTRRGGRAVILRFAAFYAADSSQSLDMAERARRRRLALIGPSRNWFSSIHLDDAAAATLAALRAPAGIYNVSDDDPVQLSTFMTSMARAAGGRGLPKLPSVAGNAALGVTWRYLRRSQRVSSARMQRLTGWTPKVHNAREGWISVAREWGRVTNSKG
jgi:nucleoside-diphosphate-sugar epimerase